MWSVWQNNPVSLFAGFCGVWMWWEDEAKGGVSSMANAMPIGLRQDGSHKRVKLPTHQVTGGAMAIALRCLIRELERPGFKDCLIEGYGIKKAESGGREFHVIFAGSQSQDETA
jgi:hypothetical protein